MADDGVYRERFEITYTEDITRVVQHPAVDHGNGYVSSAYKTKEYVGKRTMRCEVEVVVNVAEAVRWMGARACRSKGGKCQDGELTVKRIGTPKELSREMKPEG